MIDSLKIHKSIGKVECGGEDGPCVVTEGLTKEIAGIAVVLSACFNSKCIILVFHIYIL